MFRCSVLSCHSIPIHSVLDGLRLQRIPFRHLVLSGFVVVVFSAEVCFMQLAVFIVQNICWYREISCWAKTSVLGELVTSGPQLCFSFPHPRSPCGAHVPFSFLLRLPTQQQSKGSSTLLDSLGSNGLESPLGLQADPKS